MNIFPGRILHSHDFRDAEEFRNKNVIVLGSSYSAEDIAYNVISMELNQLLLDIVIILWALNGQKQ